MSFKLVTPYAPSGDQPQAIEQITNLFNDGYSKNAVLWGVTGSGKTFTMANVIKNINKPTLILSHNKTLAAQLYSEFKSFFPENAVEYFVSYYDYYQPEAYLPATDTYIEKDLAINDEIEKHRLSASSTLLSGRKDTIVVSSVSCLYGIGNPSDFHENTINLRVGEMITRNKLLLRLTDGLYSRNDIEPKRGTFRVQGDSVYINIAYDDLCYRVIFFDDEIEKIDKLEPLTHSFIETLEEVSIHPASIFVTTRQRINNAISRIQDDLVLQFNYLNSINEEAYAARLKNRVEYDLEMIKEVGYCSGIENYSLYFDGRVPGSRPFCLLDYFPDDYLLIIDESHVTLPQVRAMYGGDYSRKSNLVEFGFRLPTAKDNRPLKFEEFEAMMGRTLYVSATPANYELNRSEGCVVEQFIRPTGLLDPEIEVVPTLNQIDRVLEEIQKTIISDSRVMITTLTKRMAEELQKYLEHASIRCRYIHSDVENQERIELIENFREGLFDVLIGVNLLREGLDIPEVELVMIMDADKEGFLRTAGSMTQTAGRAARNVKGRVIMFADKITKSMNITITETRVRREKQIKYNKEHGITPTQIVKANNLAVFRSDDSKSQNISAKNKDYDVGYSITPLLAADASSSYNLSKEEILQEIEQNRVNMENSAKELDFRSATIYRDRMFELQKMLAKG
ncbi:MAG: excinuclease ABC subunit UvrB [Rikenellaceae bacterium]